jgi:hypothetical protein
VSRLGEKDFVSWQRQSSDKAWNDRKAAESSKQSEKEPDPEPDDKADEPEERDDGQVHWGTRGIRDQIVSLMMQNPSTLPDPTRDAQFDA